MSTRATREQPYGRSAITTERRFGTNVNIWLKPDEWQKLDALAKALNLSKTALARRALNEFLAAHRGPP